MSFRILGALAAETADGTSVPLGQPKQRALLAILLLHVGEIVSIDRLVELLWGDRAPRTAEHSIQIYVSELRRALRPVAGEQVIVTRPPGYLLQVAPDEVDARRFERAVVEGAAALAAGRRADGRALLTDALRLWRGPALYDFAYEEFAQPYIRRLTDLHLDAIEELAAAELADGPSGAAIPLLEAAISEDAIRERSRELLMLALYRAGRSAEALRTYEKLRELLAEELGVEPSPPLRQLQERIILHDPSLGTGPAARELADPHPRNPYKGLRAFTEEDTGDFFGRTALVDSLEQMIRGGARLVALVGPSGAGKSSVVAAGLIPRLRSDLQIRHVTPDTMGLADLLVFGADGARQLIVIDQFEELFTGTDEGHQRRFLRELTRIVTTLGPSILVSLRADLYDRPLQFAAFARVFLDGVVSILPMSAEELEEAIIRPAERAGVTIEPALLASLIADTVDQPGMLPLLQYTLTELFDHRGGQRLALTGYRRLGGLRGILTRRAEEVFATLNADEQRVANQVFLRLVRPGRAGLDSRRRLQVSELTALGFDPVELSAVLDAYGRHRLLAFGRDDDGAAATVEVAHEALLWEWERLARWVDRHRVALRRHGSFVAALAEWEESGRDAGYLLAGTRLDEFAAWADEGAILLTDTERAFLDASLEQRASRAAEQEARALAVRRLERRSRNRLIGLLGATVVLLGGATWAALAVSSQPPTVGMLIHQAGTQLDVLATRAFDQAVSDLRLVGITRDTNVEDANQRLSALSDEGPDAIIDFTLDTDVAGVASRYPQIQYVSFASGGLPRDNVRYVWFADEQIAYLAGAIAALHTKTGRIGFVGGIDVPVIWHFQAGFAAGAAAVNPDVEVVVRYLTTPPNFEGFVIPDLAKTAADALYQQDVDVIFAAAGQSGDGVLEAASSIYRDTRREVWVIGVDTDQYQTVSGVNQQEWRARILTSAVKRTDLAVYDSVQELARGTFTPGTIRLGLADGAMELATSGGRIDGDEGRIQTLEAAIIAGDIKVPCIPADRMQQATAQGISLDHCVE